MKKNFYAHINENGEKQTVTEHLEGTAALCAEFAGSFGASEQGYVIGITHDIGKCSDEFQNRLNGGHIVDHSSAGAIECAKRNAEWAACCVAGHHGGLPDLGNPYNDSASDKTLYGRLKKALEKKIPDYEMPVHVSDDISIPPNYGVDYFTDSFIIRMLYSCLVDADYLDTEAFMAGKIAKCKCGDGILSLLDKLNSYVAPWWEPKGDLNKLRCDILKKCIETGREPKGFFRLLFPPVEEKQFLLWLLHLTMLLCIIWSMSFMLYHLRPSLNRLQMYFVRYLGMKMLLSIIQMYLMT